LGLLGSHIRADEKAQTAYTFETMPPDLIMSKKSSFPIVAGKRVSSELLHQIKHKPGFPRPIILSFCLPFSFPFGFLSNSGAGSVGFPVPLKPFNSPALALAAACDC
jgi:hypothetical protein